MAQARHVGKVAIRFSPDDRPTAPVRVRRRIEDLISPDATYLLTGGLGGLGLAMARWLIDRGARHLVLMNRRGLEGAARREAVRALSKAAEVRVVAA